MDDDTLSFRDNRITLIRDFDPDFSLTEKIFQSLSDSKVLIACSGGADSIALALMCHAFGVECGIAYVEHGISEATAECEVLVKEVAHLCNYPFYVAALRMAENYDLSSNVEAQARDYRYSALEKIRETHGYDLVATAHHNDDYVETFLINLIRGSGSKTASLQMENNKRIRPLLHWRKKDLIEIVNACRVGYFDDPMNESDRFVRNRIRHEVIPLLNDVSGRDVVPLLSRAAQHISRDNAYLDAYAASLWPRGEPRTSDLTTLDERIQMHALRVWIQGYPPSHEEMMRILDVVRHDRKSVQLSGNRTIWRRGGILYQDRTDDHLHQE